MALSKERMGEIALAVLLKDKMDEGVLLQPKEEKREVANGAKKYKVPLGDAVDFRRMLVEEAYRRTMAELDKMPREFPNRDDNDE